MVKLKATLSLNAINRHFTKINAYSSNRLGFLVNNWAHEYSSKFIKTWDLAQIQVQISTLHMFEIYLFSNHKSVRLMHPKSNKHGKTLWIADFDQFFIFSTSQIKFKLLRSAPTDVYLLISISVRTSWSWTPFTLRT